MDEIYNAEPVVPEQTPETAQEELSHSDKIVGVLTNPAQTYEQMSKFPPRVIDWLLPVSVMIVIVIISSIIRMSNPEISYQMKQKRFAELEKTMNEMVEKGQLSREMADEQLEKNREMMDQLSGGFGIMLTSVSTVFGVFIIFFIMAGIYFLFSRFALKGEGSYQSALSAYGLSFYVSTLAVVIVTILTLSFGRLFTDTSVASFMGMEKSTFAGLLLSKLDIFSIWVLSVVSIGLAKMFHSKSMGKYFGMVFSIWILWSLIAFGLGKSVSVLRFLIDLA